MGAQQQLPFTAIPTTALGTLKFYKVKTAQFNEEQKLNEKKAKMKQFNEEQELNERKANKQFNEEQKRNKKKAKMKQFNEEQKLNEKKPSISDSNNIEILPPTTSIMKLARARLLEMNSKNADVFSIIDTCFAEIHVEDNEDLKIAVILQAAAEKVACKKFSCAKILLPICSRSVFKTGNPVQRTVFYFAQALKERIDRRMGNCFKENISVKHEKPIDVRQTQFSLNPATIAHQQRFSVVAISQFTGIQSILDNIATVKKIHLVDFRIRNGWQWTILMQALADRCEFPVELVKITAVGISKEMMAETGRWLSSFAESINLCFSFHIVVSELKDLREDMFKIEADEKVAIFSSLCLFSLVAFPSQLDSLICVIKNLRPCVLVVNEIDQSIDSPNFFERFTKSLFYFSALFDCASACAGTGSYRKLAEEVHFWEVIQNIVVAEGTERVFRYERVSFWRALFTKFGFAETQISSTAIFQAKLMVERSPGKNFYNVGIDGKCMTLGWKGTNFEFISAWKFNQV